MPGVPHKTRHPSGKGKAASSRRTPKGRSKQRPYDSANKNAGLKPGATGNSSLKPLLLFYQIEQGYYSLPARFS